MTDHIPSANEISSTAGTDRGDPVQGKAKQRDTRRVAPTPLECNQMVPEPPGYWHEHPCKNAASVRLKKVQRDYTLHSAVCGVHARRMRARGWVDDRGT
jgi:hypothetical protein